MSQRFYIAWSIIYLIIMAVLIIGFNKVQSWLDLFSGFVMGVTVWSLMIIYRDRNKARIKNFNFKKFLRRYVKAIIHLIVYGLLVAAAYHFGDWRHVVGVTGGYVFGLIIWRIRHGRW